jgi:hypothetical protein
MKVRAEGNVAGLLSKVILADTAALIFVINAVAIAAGVVMPAVVSVVMVVPFITMEVVSAAPTVDPAIFTLEI